MTKKIITIIVLCLIILPTQAQPNIEWQKTFGGSDIDDACCISQTSDGGYIIAGSTYSKDGDISGNYGFIDIWILKLDSNGSMLWQISLGDTIIEIASSIQQTTDGGYIVSGYSSADDLNDIPKRGTSDLLIIKLNSSGNITWQKSLGGNNTEFSGSIQQTTDGGYILGGSSKSKDGDVTKNYGDFDYWIVKLNSIGNIVWQNSYGGTKTDRLYSIQQTSDGGYIAAGNSNSKDKDVTINNGYFDYWVIKIDSIGNLIWQKSYGGSRDDFVYSVKQTSDEGYILAGTTLSIDGDASGNTGLVNYFIIKIDAMGSIEWKKSYGGIGAEDARSIIQTKDGGYVINGFTNSNDGDVSGHHNLDNYDIWVLKINNDGIIEWQKCLGGSDSEFGFSIVQTKDGGYALTGSSKSVDGDLSKNKGKSDYWIVKLSESLASLKEMEEQSQVRLFPNPSSNQITIKTSEKLIDANYIVMNLMGQTVLSGEINNENSSLDISNLASGNYFIQIQSKDGITSSRFIKE